MKFVFTITTNHDGLMPAVTTNIKALFNYIDSLNVSPKTLFNSDYKHIPYNYNNLVKLIRQNQKDNRLVVGTIYCANDYQIDIYDLVIKSK